MKCNLDCLNCIYPDCIKDKADPEISQEILPEASGTDFGMAPSISSDPQGRTPRSFSTKMGEHDRGAEGEGESKTKRMA